MNEPASSSGRGGAKITILGALLMLLGLVAIISPLVVGVSVIRLIGIIVLVGGIMRIVWAMRSGGSNIFTMAVAVLTAVCGIAILANPVFGAGILAIVLATYFVIDGVLEIAVAFKTHPATGWGFVLFSGIVSLILGVLVWQQFPLSGAWAIGVLIGVKLLLAGLVMTTVGSTIRALGRGGM